MSTKHGLGYKPSLKRDRDEGAPQSQAPRKQHRVVVEDAPAPAPAPTPAAGAGAGDTEPYAYDAPSHSKRMHPRNEYLGKPPNFGALAAKYKSFAPYVKADESGAPALDFRDPYALRELTTVLLKEDFNLDWVLPIDQLCPTLSSRLNYIHWVEDLLRTRVPEAFPALDLPARGLDVGTGASCIYALLGHRVYGWNMLASEVDADAASFAQRNVEANGLSASIDVRVVPPATRVAGVLEGVTAAGAAPWLRPLPATLEGKAVLGAARPRDGDAAAVDHIDFCMCNPPFFGDVNDANKNPSTANTGTPSELATEGGELAFVRGILADSLALGTKVTWYTTMLGAKVNWLAFKEDLKAQKVTCVHSTRLFQGRTVRWAVAWSFCPSSSFAPMPVQEEDAKPAATSHAFSPEGVDAGEAERRLLQLFESRGMATTLVDEGATKKWRGVSKHEATTKKAKPEAGGDVDPLTLVDNEFRFEVAILDLPTSGMGCQVTVAFVAGRSCTIPTFLRLANTVEGDICRVNRYWRRRLAREAEAAKK